MKRDNSYLIGNQFAVGAKPNKTAFKNGSEPWNKGLKGVRLSPATEFKKGQRGIKWKPVGTQTIRKDKTGTLRRFVKVAEPNIWKLYAVHIWEAKFGQVPRGLILHHRDHNSLHDELNNLCVLTRTAHIKEHRRDLERGKRKRQTRLFA